MKVVITRSIRVAIISEWNTTHTTQLKLAAKHNISPSSVRNIIKGRTDKKERTRLRFENKVQKTDTCWVWTGAVVINGFPYGLFRPGNNQTMVLAHRFSYTTYVGEIPEGLFVLHRCDNPRCVNPEHLFLGTQLDNVRDMYSKGRQKRKVLHKDGSPKCRYPGRK